MDAFSNAVKKYIEPSEHELHKILYRFKMKEIKKGRLLGLGGEAMYEFMFIEKGCLRVFWERDDIEITGWFAFEDEFFCELGNFIPQQPSAFKVQAIEDTTVLYINRNDLNNLFLEVPVFETFIRKFWEHIIAHLVNAIVSYQTETADKRYEKAVRHPKLLQRVPLKYLSSYLGITPSSLSRLRRQKL
jgi:CRP/FNR family transcriptional regulator, anaerobic regulatory protein